MKYYKYYFLNRVIFGSIQWTMDFGMRFASMKKFYGGSWSPVCLLDFNILKNILFSWASAIPVCWMGIPFETARKAYYADLTWPAELRKGFRSPLHALCKIPFTRKVPLSSCTIFASNKWVSIKRFLFI